MASGSSSEDTAPMVVVSLDDSVEPGAPPADRMREFSAPPPIDTSTTAEAGQTVGGAIPAFFSSSSQGVQEESELSRLGAAGEVPSKPTAAAAGLAAASHSSAQHASSTATSRINSNHGSGAQAASAAVLTPAARNKPGSKSSSNLGHLARQQELLLHAQQQRMAGGGGSGALANGITAASAATGFGQNPNNAASSSISSSSSGSMSASGNTAAGGSGLVVVNGSNTATAAAAGSGAGGAGGAGGALGTARRPVSPSVPATFVQFTVGKIDAGIAILLTDDHHVIEFPALLLPEGVEAGSIVNIAVQRNRAEERTRQEEFMRLQSDILREFSTPPEPPIISLRTATQTSLTIQWEPLVLHSVDLRALEVYRDGVKHTNQVPLPPTAVRLSGLDVGREYEIYLRLRTSGGAVFSNNIRVKTSTMEDLSGVNICFSQFADRELEEAIGMVKALGASVSPELNMEVTHLIAKAPQGGKYEQAIDWNIPVVKIDWLRTCFKTKRLQPSGGFYLS